MEAAARSPTTGLSKMLGDPAMREFIHQSQLNTIKQASSFLSPDKLAALNTVLGNDVNWPI